jgi:DNA repair ATPase RecN
VKLLNAEERIEELAKMVGGNDYSDASLKIAREMVQN